ncbi:hypothetical protein BGZ61DRAFT_204429 [Ilyonectria robusta]|uniref:uncharacterized protein n=1 Tax=Ilyonectria robusta TaxID=1079257 RepID=UPI001E8D64AA|nr:uncharacterized protein BGZ61DRAFT_204429 [Ilyonectria robusta]KAH8654285.1 hypothetical protein BGZ61DRAFT_204429 [Ilyonectria robusta]
MPIPTVVPDFEYGTNAAPTSSLETLVRRQLEIAARAVGTTAVAPAMTPPVHPNSLIIDMGDYLTRAARVWFHLTTNLVDGPHVGMAVVDAHEQMRLENHVSELSPIMLMDLEFGRLRKIRGLAEKLSCDLQNIWAQKPFLVCETTSSLPDLVHLLEIAAREVAMSATAPAPTPPALPNSLISDIGDYLTQAARVWPRLTVDLFNRRLSIRNHVSDLPLTVFMNVGLRRIRKTAYLVNEFSRNVQKIWPPIKTSVTGNPPSQTPMTPVSMIISRGQPLYGPMQEVQSRRELARRRHCMLVLHCITLSGNLYRQFPSHAIFITNLSFRIASTQLLGTTGYQIRSLQYMPISNAQHDAASRGSTTRPRRLSSLRRGMGDRSHILRTTSDDKCS